MGVVPGNEGFSQEMKGKYLLVAGSVICFAAVALGAFGAHGLQEILTGVAGDWYNTAFQYQFFHGLAILICAMNVTRLGRMVWYAGVLLALGTVVFSGTLYAMSLGAPSWLGIITPIGGFFLLGGWGTLIVAGVRGDPATG